MRNRIRTVRIVSSHERRGAVLAWCAVLMVVMIGMTGLVIDGGLLLSSHRRAQNAADAGAMAAAMALQEALITGVTLDATAIATTAVTDASHNGLTGANVTVNIPPAAGPYAGESNYAEVLVSHPIPTYFIHVLPGVAQGNTATARAVAGFEVVITGPGVVTLNPNAIPGLNIGGGAELSVEGAVIVNSEGGGVDEDGNAVILDGPGQTATTISNNGLLEAASLNIVGGVNSNGLDNIVNITEGGPNPLHANSLPYPDPYQFLPTPTTSNGVLDVFHGSPSAANGGYNLDDAHRDPESLNAVVNIGGNNVLVLHPGVYTKIAITGGRVLFTPGIYVLQADASTSDTLVITGTKTVVDGQGIMFYNTGDDYDPTTGAPDSGDSTSTNPVSSAEFGGVTINTGVNVNLKGLDTANEDYDYSETTAVTPIDSMFNGMLFYQRRANDERIQVEGNSANLLLEGNFYAKTALLKLDGQATFNSSFVVGEMSVEGQATLTIRPQNNTGPQSSSVFLVE